MTKALEGKTALVTGAARGIGRGIAERLAESGALVVVNYASNAQAARETIAAIEAKGGKAFAVQAQLATSESIQAFVAALDDALMKRTGQKSLDILINNIGGGEYGTIETTSAELFDQTFSNNVRVPFFLTQALLSRLNNGGRIINISSAGARLTGNDFIAYSMSKAAVNQFTRIMAKEVGPRNITVNAVCPGFTATSANEEVMSDPATAKAITEMTALRRFGETSDIADIVHALASSDGRWVTGQIVEASGGFNL